MRAIQISRFGGPEVLELVELPEPSPGPGQRRIRVSRAGVNYADTHQVENSYLAPAHLPLVPGAEVVGYDDAGRRIVALVSGGYAQVAVAADALSFEVPAELDDAAALALVLQGTTAWHLLRTSGHLAAGESVVVHAAAGGVGSLAVQLARSFGAGRVIATASTPAKRELALSLGAHAVLDPAESDLAAALRAANAGAGVDLVLEMTGDGVFDASLAALAPFGRLVVFGMASRVPASPLAPAALMARSASVAGFWLAHCLARPAMLAQAFDEVSRLAVQGELRTVIGGQYPLSAARAAHEALRARQTVGKLVLDPSG